MAKFKEILKEYLLNATFHGAKFIISPDYHPLERVFWGCCILLSWWGAGELIKSSISMKAKTGQCLCVIFKYFQMRSIRVQ